MNTKKEKTPSDKTRSGSKQNKMATMPMNSLLWTMAIPLMMSLLVQSLYNIVDSIFVSRLSEQALTATSLAYPVQFLMIAVGVGTAVGMNALLSKMIGQNRGDDACRVATTGFFLTLATSVIFSTAGLLFSTSIAHAFTDDTEIADLCSRYLLVCMAVCFGNFFQTYAQRLLQAVGDTFLSMMSLIIGAVTNMILDPIMIFGLFHFPRLGITGAAIATVIGQCLGAVSALLFNRLKNPLIHIRFKNYRFEKQDVLAIYRVGLPTIIMQAIGSFMTMAVNAVLISISSTAVAFFGVYYKLQNFLMMPMNGLGQASIPIVGFNYGAGNRLRIKQAWDSIRPAGILFSLFATVVFMLFPGNLLRLFAASGEMLSIGIPAIRIMAPTFVFATFSILIGYFCSGLQNGIVNMISAAIRQLVILVPGIWLLTRYFGLPYTWMAFWFAEAAAFIFSEISFRKLLRKAGV